MLEALDRDSLVLQSVRVDALYGLVTLMDDALENATFLRPPTLVLYGARERIIPRAAREEFIRRLQASQPVLIYPQGHHTLLRDRNAAVVLRDVARWIGDISMPPSGQVASLKNAVVTKGRESEVRGARWLNGPNCTCDSEKAGGVGVCERRGILLVPGVAV
jgi:hypothetical protein